MIPPFDPRRNLSPRLAAGRFLRAACERDAAAAEHSGDLFEAFLFWCHVTATRPVSQRHFGLELAKLGFEVIRHGKAWRHARSGLRIKPGFTKREKAIQLVQKPESARPRVGLVQESRTVKANPCHDLGNG